MVPALYGFLCAFSSNLNLISSQTVKFHAIRGMPSSLMKIESVTDGYHRTIARQFTQRSGHHPTDRIDWKETRKLLQTFHPDEQSLL